MLRCGRKADPFGSDLAVRHFHHPAASRSQATDSADPHRGDQLSEVSCVFIRQEMKRLPDLRRRGNFFGDAIRTQGGS